MPTQAAPIVVEASGDFLGNDGAWSSFLVSVGNPPTELKLLASTEIPGSWVVLPLGCTPSDGVSNCTQARGGTFDITKSKTWSDKGNFQLGTESNLGMTQNSDVGDFGFDTVGIGLPEHGNVSLNHQLVAGIATKDFLLGNLGLAARTLNFSDNTQANGLIPELKSNNLIPSLSYGYTAGASYQKINASLTLGGFDASRFTPNDVSFTFDPNPLRSKLVALQSVLYTDSKSKGTALLQQPILTLVDSTVPHIWLPVEACQAFEVAFGITYDSISNLYLINDTLHDTLVKTNPQVIFQLANSLTGGPAVNITLPYASFDLEVSEPIVKNSSRYFPLRQAADETQYTLGRTFFQESFIIVNYESSNFSISQSVFSKDTPSHIVAIAPVESQSAAPASPSNTVSSTLPPITKITSQPSHSSHSLATPAIAGIAIAIVVILLVGALSVWLKFKHKRSHKGVPELPTYPPCPPDKVELGDGTSGSSNEKKVPGVSVAEVSDEKQAQIDRDEIQLMDDQGNHGGHGVPVEIGGSDTLRPELEGQNPFAIPELSSPEVELMRSELSTPEPGWPAEMPSPEMVSSEMPSPELGGPIVEEPSPQVDTGPSPISSPDSLWSRNRSFSRRPNHGRVDSSDSEGGWARDRMHSAPTRPYPPSRINSNDSSEPQQPGWVRDRNPSSASSRQRLARARFDSADSSDNIAPGATFTSVRPAHTRADSSDSEAFGQNVPQRRPSLQQSRPAHRRLDSNDSAETWETRLEMSPPGSPYFPYTPRPGRDRHVEALPSIGPESSQEALMSPGVMSIRSGLRSPEPLGREVKEEEEERSERPGSEASKK